MNKNTLNEFKKSFIDKLPNNLKNKFGVRLCYGPRNACLKLSREDLANSFIDKNKQSDFAKEPLEYYTNYFASIKLDGKDTITFENFNAYFSYGEFDADVIYSFNQAKDISLALNAFIDTANEFKGKLIYSNFF